MHCGCTFLIRKVQDTSARLTDVRPSTQVARLRGTVGCGRLALDAETWVVGAET